MQELSQQRLKVEGDARSWADAPESDNKQVLGAPLILRMIAAMRDDLRQDLAKDQINKAIKALWRHDQAAVSQHIKMAFHGVAHVPVATTWDELAIAAHKLQREHPMDDPIDESL